MSETPKYHCVRQLERDSWEYRIKTPADAPNVDDLVHADDAADLRTKVQALLARIDGCWLRFPGHERDAPLESLPEYRAVKAALEGTPTPEGGSRS